MSVAYKKTAMTLYSLERNLGEVVVSSADPNNFLDTKVAKEIISRERHVGNDVSDIRELIAASYFGEIVDLLIASAEGTSILEDAKRLKSILEDFEIYEVRNCIAHPNRPFLDTYWYRVAAVCTDPALERLGLGAIKADVSRAEEGLITDPPEEWIAKKQSSIRNNLPVKFEHEITGLLGRAKEKREIISAILNPRLNLFALVGPGGLGKTALALDILHDLCTSIRQASTFDAVIFVSLKTEALTVGGLTKLSAAQTISELELAVADAYSTVFSDANIEQFSDLDRREIKSKVLLCIDNLETLLSDQQGKFDDFNQTLPEHWKVLVTSRINVSSAWSKAIEPLDEDAALKLSYKYASRQPGLVLTSAQHVQIVRASKFNPLGIRLTLDAMMLGKPATEAIRDTVSSVVDYSFKNLVGALSPKELLVLEAIFVLDKSTRYQIESASSLTRDEINSAVYKLTRTSLVLRGRGSSDMEDEVYRIADNVRDLVLGAPYGLDIRREIIEAINKKKDLAREITHAQREVGISQYHERYINPSLEDHLKIEISKTWRALKSGDPSFLAERYKVMSSLEHSYANSPEFKRTLARLVARLGDSVSAERHYLEAVSLDSDDPVTRTMISRFYFDSKEYEKAIVQNEFLRDRGWWDPDKSDEKFSAMAISGYFLSILFTGGHQRVLDETKCWKESRFHRGLLGVFRASAHKRSIEMVVNTDIQAAIPALISAVRILSDVFVHDGYLKSGLAEAAKIIDEIYYVLSVCPEKIETEIASEWLKFMDYHLIDVLLEKKPEKVAEYVTSLRKLNIDGVENPFFGSAWKQWVVADQGADSSNRNSDDIVVGVTNIHHKDKGYCFAKDSLGNKYFVHYSQFKNVDPYRWGNLKVGDKIICRPGAHDDPNKAIRAEQCALVTDYLGRH